MDEDSRQRRNRHRGERLRREDPERTAPIRNMSGAFHRPSRDLYPEPGDGGPPPGGTTSRAVEEGYRVVEEHIRQGQRIAQQIRGAVSDGGNAESFQGFGGRPLHLLTDLLGLWVDLLGALFPGRGASLRPPWTAAGSWGAPLGGADGSRLAGASGVGTTRVSVFLDSSLPARVTLELAPHRVGAPLGTHGLRAAEPGKPPLLDVVFEPAGDQLASLQVRIREDQPPGTYTGVVFDQETGQPYGILCIDLIG